jgi:aspartate/methionine/tyrosine aminotransferase
MAFAEQSAALERAGHDVVKLSLGEPDFGAPRPVREAMRAVMDGRPLPYTRALGSPELRAAIAGFYRSRHGVDVDPERILITSGASAALLVALAATTDPGDDVLLADPSYPCNRQTIATFGGRLVLVPTSAQTRYQLDCASVLQAWTPATRTLMVASPSNPTGTTVPFEELTAMCAVARARDAWRIVDEIYLELADHDAAGRPAASILTADPGAIVINSFSKFFGMTGWRLGWCVLPDGLVEAAERLAMNYFLCASTPAQIAAVECFSDESLAECEQRRLELLQRRQIVLEGLQRLGLRVLVPPNGAFYVYFDVSSTGLDAWTFCERALNEAHVALTPGRDFGAETADTHVRLSYASSQADLHEGMRRLEAFVAGLPGSAANPEGR